MTTTPDWLLYEDRHFLVVNKAPGLLSQGDRTGDAALADVVRSHLADSLPPKEGKPRNPFVAPVHRLDRPASGALILARTSKAADRFARQFREDAVHKGYLALAEGELPRHRRITIHLRKERKTNTVVCQLQPFPGARAGTTRIQPVHVTQGGQTLVALFPSEGRPHQLRATLAFLKAPIAGDLRYGASRALDRLVALHCHTLTFAHPISQERITVRAPFPAAWLSHWPWLADILPAPLLPPRT